MPFDWVPSFLACLAEVPNVSEACRAAQVSRQAAYNHKAADPEFAAAWDDAMEQSTDTLVGECYRRAKDGLVRKSFTKSGAPIIDPATGQQYSERQYSDTLAIFLLKAHRPKVYREKVEHSGPDGGPIEVNTPALSEAARELSEWRDAMAARLPTAGPSNTPSAAPTSPTSSTPA